MIEVRGSIGGVYPAVPSGQFICLKTNAIEIHGKEAILQSKPDNATRLPNLTLLHEAVQYLLNVEKDKQTDVTFRAQCTVALQRIRGEISLWVKNERFVEEAFECIFCIWPDLKGPPPYEGFSDGKGHKEVAEGS
ncbi:hypothetical protein IFR05_017417 [Cadophora sp. M221]|nr:hypothetical protein IFR05_017417 [Cadophora sp. M221]